MKTLTTIALCGLIATGCMVDAASTDDATGNDERIARVHFDRRKLPNHVPFADASGLFTTVSAQGSIDLGNEFFQDLGSNGRRCVSCHVPSAGWSVTPQQLQAVFTQTAGGALDDGIGLGAAF